MNYEYIIFICLLLFSDVSHPKIICTLFLMEIYKVIKYYIKIKIEDKNNKKSMKEHRKRKSYEELSNLLDSLKEILYANCISPSKKLNRKKILLYHQNLEKLTISKYIAILPDDDEFKKMFLDRITYLLTKDYIERTEILRIINELTEVQRKYINN